MRLSESWQPCLIFRNTDGEFVYLAVLQDATGVRERTAIQPESSLWENWPNREEEIFSSSIHTHSRTQNRGVEQMNKIDF